MDIITSEDFERRLLDQNIQTAQVLGSAIAMRDHDTGDHNLRVALAGRTAWLLRQVL